MAKRRAIVELETSTVRDETLAARLESLFEKNRTATDELRGVVSEAHGVLRDLRAEIKKAERVGPAIVTKRLRVEVERAITELGTATEETIKKASDRVNARFDEQMALLLGEDDPSKPSVVEMLDRLGPLVPILTSIARGEKALDTVKVLQRDPSELPRAKLVRLINRLK